MEAEFWHERWRRSEIGFHQQHFNVHLEAFVDRLEIGAGAHVFVPLCGKSRDMLWLHEQGFRVSGVEISARATEDFFRENRIDFRVVDLPDGQRFSSDGIDLYCADFFATDLAGMPAVDAVYDRAALVALPPAMRPAYVGRLMDLAPAGARMLLVTTDYPSHQMPGPPFSITPGDVEQLFTPSCDIERLHSEDCLPREPRFRAKGLSRMQEHVFLLRRRPKPAKQE